jgi:hypothetical protein
MASDLFIDGFGRIVFREGIMRIELVSLSEEEPQVTHNLVMTLPAFLRGLQLQQEIVQKFQEAGIIRQAPPEAGGMPVVAAAEASAATVVTSADPAPSVPAPLATAPQSPNFQQKK